MAAMPAVGMGVGVDPVATGIAMVKSAMETTGIGGDLQAVHPRIEPGVVFQKVVDATNAQREAGVVHPVVVVAVQGVAIQQVLVRELVAQEVPVPAPFEGMPDA